MYSSVSTFVNLCSDTLTVPFKVSTLLPTTLNPIIPTKPIVVTSSEIISLLLDSNLIESSEPTKYKFKK